MKKMSKNSGVSLLITILFVSAFLLVMAGLFKVRLQTMDAIGNRELDAKADYLSQSAFELASYWAQIHSDGQSTADFTADPAYQAALFKPLHDAATTLGFANCANSNCAGFEVTGRATEEGSTKKIWVTFTNAGKQEWYSVPAGQTGDAAPACSVDPLDANFANDPCNWNKLYVGKSIDIPLYYVDSGGQVIVLNSDFRLRVRAPLCNVFGFASSKCDANGPTGRIVLYPQPSLNFGINYYGWPFRNVDVKKDPVLIQWTIDDSVNGNGLSAWDFARIYRGNMLREITNDDRQNTEISGGRINDANPNFNPNPDVYINDFVVLSSTLPGKDITRSNPLISSFLSDSFAQGGKPVLHLTMIDQPRIDDDDLERTSLNPASFNDAKYNVSYLEYQLLTQQAPVTDTKSYLSAWTEFGGFRKEIKKQLNRSNSIGGFALENF